MTAQPSARHDGDVVLRLDLPDGHTAGQDVRITIDDGRVGLLTEQVALALVDLDGEPAYEVRRDSWGRTLRVPTLRCPSPVTITMLPGSIEIRVAGDVA